MPKILRIIIMSSDVKKLPCGDKCKAPTLCRDVLGGKCVLQIKNKQEDTPTKPGNITGKKRY